MERQEIIELFRYPDLDRSLFSYIDDYARRIDLWLLDNKPSHDQLRRYMLARLFVHYRAVNHTGSTFTTDLEDLEAWASERHKNEYRPLFSVLNDHLATPIQSLREYLDLIGLARPRDFRRVADGGLFDFVVTGHYSEETPDT